MKTNALRLLLTVIVLPLLLNLTACGSPCVDVGKGLQLPEVREAQRPKISRELMQPEKVDYSLNAGEKLHGWRVKLTGSP